MPVKQTDIALHAQVSPAAVSMVLRDPEHPQFPPETRDRIIRIARELNYVPNRTASNLRRGRSHAISLISAYNITELQDAVAEGLAPGDFGLMLHFSREGNHASLAKAVRTVLSEQPAGLIWLPAWGSEATFDRAELRDARSRVRDLGCPVVWLMNEPAWREQSDFVWCDDRVGIDTAVEHLVDGGYEHLVFLSQGRPDLPRAWRWSSFEQAAAARCVESRYVECRVHATPDDEIVHNLVRSCPPDTAIFCEGDWSAVPVVEAAHRFGRRIPDDLGVMTYGDSRIGSGFSVGQVLQPHVTAIRRPFDAIGGLAVERLVARVEGRYRGRHRQDRLATKLIVRASTRRGV